jgi:salicylate hydroxylase
MLPFLGLGAAMAIEDAAVLGRAMAVEPDALRALQRYDAARRPRATEVAEASVRQGAALQAKDPDHFKGDEAPVANRAFFDYDPMTVPV